MNHFFIMFFLVLVFFNHSPLMASKEVSPSFFNCRHLQGSSETNFCFVKLRKGKFQMGSPESEVNRQEDEDQVKVIISKKMAMMKTEVTQMQWFLIMNSNPSHFKEKEFCPNSYRIINGESLCPQNPVEQVSWVDVKKFIEKLNNKIGKKMYRLPTEAEWEYAARAGTVSAFNLGHNITTTNINFDGTAPYNDGEEGIYREQTLEVASLSNKNKWGLYDMHGNVSEWVEDIYTEQLPGGVDPQVTTGMYEDRIVRGGSWYNSGRFLRSAFRDFWNPNSHFFNVGFRLVKTL